jgi:uncharacterized protein with GYD domain
MPTYIVLSRWTEEGVRAVKEAPERIRRSEEAFEKLGARMIAWYLTMGEYDHVRIVEAPDDETMARIALSLGS